MHHTQTKEGIETQRRATALKATILRIGKKVLDPRGTLIDECPSLREAKRIVRQHNPQGFNCVTDGLAKWRIKHEENEERLAREAAAREAAQSA